MELILLAACFAVTMLTGFALLNILLYKSRTLAFPEKLALSYGMGIGVLTLEMFLYYFLNMRLTVLNILLPWVPIVIFGMFFTGENPPTITGKGKKLTLFEKFLIGGISAEVILAFWRAFLKPLESFDSVAMYAVRSKAIYLSGMIPANFFKQITQNFPNPDYPLLLPLAESWVYAFLGSLNDFLVKAIFPVYFLSFLIIFFLLLKRLMSRARALTFTFLLATIPQLNRFAAIGYADLILAYYYFLGTIFLYLWMREGNLRFLILSGVSLGFAIWTKNEGIVLCLTNLILVALFWVSNLKKVHLKHVAMYLAAIILISGPWLMLRTSVPLENDLFGFSATGFEGFSDIFRRLNRIPTILYEFQKQFFGPKKWNLTWILFLIVLILNFRKSFSADLKYLTLSVILVMLFYGGVYLLIPVEGPINWYLSTTASRLFIHFAPVAIFWLAIMNQTHEDTFGKTI